MLMAPGVLGFLRHPPGWEPPISGVSSKGGSDSNPSAHGHSSNPDGSRHSSNPGGSRHDSNPDGHGTGPSTLRFCCYLLRLGSLLVMHGWGFCSHLSLLGSLRSVISSSRVGGAKCWSSTGFNSVVYGISSSAIHIRSVMHSWRSLAALHNVWSGPPDHWAQLCRALDRARVFSLPVSLTLWEPWTSSEGRKLLPFKVLRLAGGGSHHPTCSNWAVGRGNPTACLLACCCTMVAGSSLEHPPVQWVELRPQVECGSFIPTAHALTLSLDWLIGSSIVWDAHEPLMVVDPSDEMALDLGLAPPSVCTMLLIVHPFWLSHLGSDQRAGGSWGSQTPSILLLIRSTFRPFEEASQQSWWVS